MMPTRLGDHWDRRFMLLAEHIATWSKDPDIKVGAVLVGQNIREISLGYNGFPPPVPDKPEYLNDRETKKRLMQHAERNALDNARFDAEGGVLYLTMFPCYGCAKSIVTLGIGDVVYSRKGQPATDEQLSLWTLQTSGVMIHDR